MTMRPELRSEIACSHCGHRKVEEMPTDACLFFYECEGCRTLQRPIPGDCPRVLLMRHGALPTDPA